MEAPIIDYYKNKKVLVTGGYGFLGQYIIEKLNDIGIKSVITFSSKDYDLRIWENCDNLIHYHKPDIVIHCAADVGGIQYNKTNPGSVFYNNASMALNLIESCNSFGVKKFVGIGSVCSYPKITPVPFQEHDLWNGYPEETNAPYGLSKKVMLTQGQAYHEQYDMQCLHLLLANLYGPRDNFGYESSHVIPALVKRFFEAKREKKKTVTVWGDGSPTREFIYAEDAAEAIIRAGALYENSDPVNIGTGEEISIRNLTEIIAKEIGYEGSILWNTSMPNGQPRRCLNISKAEKEFGFKAKIKFKDGIKNVIEWYKKNER